METALQEKKPTKKMSLIRQLLPKIEEALERGLSKKEVWESLNNVGLEMNYKMFLIYLSRTELQSKAVATQGKDRANQNKVELGQLSTHAALSQARKDAAETDYSKIIRKRSTRDKK